MPLIPTPGSMRTMGANRLWSGLRTGDQRSVLVGAGLFAFAWLRSTRMPKRQLLFRREVPEGSSIVVRSGKAGELPEVEVVKMTQEVT